MTTADRIRQPDAAALDARYGRTPSSRGRQRLIIWVAAIAFVLIFAAWVIWTTFDGDGTAMETRDIGHTIVDDSTVRVSFELSVKPGSEVGCAVEVQNEMHAIVGWKIVEIPASERYTRTFTEIVRTTEPGVTGLIYRCWLA